eukprot:UN12345
MKFLQKSWQQLPHSQKSWQQSQKSWQHCCHDTAFVRHW